jgi:L-rhamnose mutarotase
VSVGDRMRIAFTMTIDPGQAAEYEERHNPIWPELEATLIDHGVRSYSIFLDRATGNLFAYAEIEDADQWQSIAKTDVCQRWWDYMAPIMAVNDDDSPKTTKLDEVFHIE